jgi:nucleoside-diphosphate-sugar epimerase
MLAAEGYRGIILDCNPQTTLPPDGFTYCLGDIRDASLVERLVASVDRVIHLAAAHHDDGLDENTYREVNVNGMAILLAAMSRFNVLDLVFTSTVAVYGEHPGADETSQTSPVSPYGITKLEAERLVHAWTAASPLNRAVILRPAVIVGPGHFANMYSLMRQIDRGLYLRVGSMSNIKSLSSVQQVIGAGEWMRSRIDQRYQVANVISQPQLTSAQIMAQIAASMGRSEPKLTIPLQLAEYLGGAIGALANRFGISTDISEARVRKLFASETRFNAVYLDTAGFASPESTETAIKSMASWYLSRGRELTREKRLPPRQPTLRDVSTSIDRP